MVFMVDIDRQENTQSNDLFSQISQILIDARKKVATTVNTAMVQAYWHIGKLLSRRRVVNLRQNMEMD